jgi:hypothetical protein
MLVNGMSVWKPFAADPEYCRGPIRHDGREIVAPSRVRHAERAEEPLLGERVEGLSAHAFDDDAGERVAGVAIEVLRPGGKLSIF